MEFTDSTRWPIVTLEAGATHGGFEGCMALIDATPPADAIKFQVVWAANLLERRPMTLRYQDAEGWHEERTEDLLRGRELPWEAWAAVAQYAATRGVEWFATPDTPDTARRVVQLGACALKVAAADMGWRDLVKACMQQGVTVLLDTRADDYAFAQALDLAASTPIVLVHTPMGYPTQEPGFERLDRLIRDYPGVPVGYTSHDVGTEDCVIAAKMGAAYIEKGVSRNPGARGIEHMLCLAPDEVEHFVGRVKAASPYQVAA